MPIVIKDEKIACQRMVNCCHESEPDTAWVIELVENYKRVLDVMEKVIAYRAIYTTLADQVEAGTLEELASTVLQDTKQMYSIFEALKKHKIT